MTVDLATRRALRHQLLAWFRREARDLPWRRTRDPYRIWVSEIMLQQTQVKTVLPYYQRWLRRFPTVRSLAAAPLDQVLKAWEGLGYYQRARNLHRASQRIISEHAGKFPRRFEEVLALPGVGRYTAGAICSIAFDAPVPVLDGNVARVLSRYFGLRFPVKTSTGQRRLWRVAESLVPTTDAGDFNQSLMELGALVCLPQTPQCAECPLRRGCHATRTGNWTRLPNLGRRVTMEKRARVAALVRHARKTDSVLLTRNSSATLLRGLWRLPTVEMPPRDSGGTIAVQRRRLEEKFLREFGLRLRFSQPLNTIQHSVTSYRITLTTWEAHDSVNAATEITRNGHELRWFTEAQARRVATDAPTRRVLKSQSLERPSDKRRLFLEVVRRTP